MTSRELLDFLFATSRMNLRRGALLDSAPPALPEPVDFDRIEGMLLGLAIGDALGMSTEGRGWSVERRRHLYPGPIRDYFDSFGRPDPIHGRGKPSDDTQLAFWTLEQILADGRFDAQNVASLFAQRGDEIVGRGGTVTEFCKRGRANATPWYDWAPSPNEGFAGAGLGNGAVMRIAPILIPHLTTRTSDLWADAALCARITHNSALSTASALAVVQVIWRCLGTQEIPKPEWWLSQFVEVVEPLETESYPPRRARGTGANPRTLAEVLTVFLPKAMQQGLSVREACSEQGWASSSFVLETMPSLVYLLMRHGQDFEQAVITAAYDTHDNDTIAAVTGAILGALHGKKAIPVRWIKNLTGRTRQDDDGQVFRLIEQVRNRYCDN